MKVGDLVKLDPSARWLQDQEMTAIGMIVKVLDGGSHRKNTSYEVMWSNVLLRGGNPTRMTWEVSRGIVPATKEQ